MLSLIGELFQIAWTVFYFAGEATLLGVLYFAPDWKRKLPAGGVVALLLGAIPLLPHQKAQHKEDAFFADRAAILGWRKTTNTFNKYAIPASDGKSWKGASKC